MIPVILARFPLASMYNKNVTSTSHPFRWYLPSTGSMRLPCGSVIDTCNKSPCVCDQQVYQDIEAVLTIAVTVSLALFIASYLTQLLTAPRCLSVPGSAWSVDMVCVNVLPLLPVLRTNTRDPWHSEPLQVIASSETLPRT